MADQQQDTPLSIVASIAGILTFFVALLAAVYARFTFLRNSDDDFFKVKTSLLWYKTESTWLSELVRATADSAGDGPFRDQLSSSRTGLDVGRESYRGTAEYQMYAFVMDDLIRLEERLLELVAETEEKAGTEEKEVNDFGKPGAEKSAAGAERWTLVPKGWGWSWNRTTIAMAWMPVRKKALELVRQRDALTARVLFTQMSMISSRIRELEQRAVHRRQSSGEEALKRLEETIKSQQEQIQRLEAAVYRTAQNSSLR